MLLCITLFAQISEDHGFGLKLKMDEEDEKYLRFILWNQIWFQYQENNPGTLVSGEPQTPPAVLWRDDMEKTQLHGFYWQLP